MDLAEHFIDVARDFDRLEDIPDDALLVNDKRRPLWVAVRVGKHPEHRADRTTGVGEQWRPQVVLRYELLVRLDRVSRDAHGDGVEPGEVSRPLTEVTCFVGSAGRHILRIGP